MEQTVLIVKSEDWLLRWGYNLCRRGAEGGKGFFRWYIPPYVSTATVNTPKYPVFPFNKTRYCAYIHRVKITGLKKNLAVELEVSEHSMYS